MYSGIIETSHGDINVMYTGHFPCLCSGNFIIEIEREIHLDLVYLSVLEGADCLGSYDWIITWNDNEFLTPNEQSLVNDWIMSNVPNPCCGGCL